MNTTFYKLLFAGVFVFMFGHRPNLANAQSKTIAVKMSTVTNNCGDKAPNIEASEVSLAESAEQVQLAIAGIPELFGKKHAKGKLRLTAKSNEARYSANGRHSNDSLRLVLIIEHFNGTKPTCTQSFSIRSR